MVLPGSPTGLSRSQARRITTQEVFGRVEVSAGLGERLAVGDLDADGIDDLVLGMPGLYVDDQERAGGIAVLFGDPAGVNRGGTPSVVLTQNSPGVPGISEVYDQFGNALATGDFDGDEQTELAVGVGWEQPPRARPDPRPGLGRLRAASRRRSASTPPAWPARLPREISSVMPLPRATSRATAGMILRWVCRTGGARSATRGTAGVRWRSCQARPAG